MLRAALLVLAVALPLQSQTPPPSGIHVGSGPAPAAGCNSAAQVGRLYARNDAAAPNATLFVCANIGAKVYAWESVHAGPLQTSVGLTGDGSKSNPARIDPNAGVLTHLRFTDSSDPGALPNGACSKPRPVQAAGVTVADTVLVGNPFLGIAGLFAVAQPENGQIVYQLCNLSGAAQRPGNRQYTFFVIRSF